MKIYYSVSVRGTGGVLTKPMIRQHINILKSFGEVLTEHLGSDSPQILDMNGKSDSDIYEEDDRLLQSCDAFVADITNASLGVGFMVARALTYNKPVICLHYNNPDVKLSAMINGCPSIMKLPYNNDQTYRQGIRNFLLNQTVMTARPMKIFLCGSPGSGKSSCAQKIADTFNLANISTGAILREIVKDPSNPMTPILSGYMNAGQLIPADIMCKIVIDRLKQPDCLRFGFVLDGYPPSMEDLDNLRINCIAPDLMFCFECSDETAITRQCSRGERISDTRETATKRVQVYHEKIPDFVKHGGEWFDFLNGGPIVRINAECGADAVWESVEQTIRHWKNPSRSPSSFFPIPPFHGETPRSTRFHFHIDAVNQKSLFNILRKVYAKYQPAQGNIKIYPIHSLHLGPQIDECSSYERMMNFHSISDGSDEAFVTGRLGNSLDVEFLTTVLQSAINKEYMVELEQYIGEWRLRGDQIITESDYASEPVDVRSLFPTYEKHHLANPPIELHLGFNIPHIVRGGCPPIPLDLLMKQCTNNGFTNGGWFIFRHETDWVYRSNEFSTDTVETAKTRLFEQAKTLRVILSELGVSPTDILFSLEHVHGIWQFNTLQESISA